MCGLHVCGVYAHYIHLELLRMPVQLRRYDVCVFVLNARQQHHYARKRASTI